MPRIAIATALGLGALAMLFSYGIGDEPQPTLPRATEAHPPERTPEPSVRRGEFVAVREGVIESSPLRTSEDGDQFFGMLPAGFDPDVYQDGQDLGVWLICRELTAHPVKYRSICPLKDARQLLGDELSKEATPAELESIDRRLGPINARIQTAVAEWSRAFAQAKLLAIRDGRDRVDADPRKAADLERNGGVFVSTAGPSRETSRSLVIHRDDYLPLAQAYAKLERLASARESIAADLAGHLRNR